VNSNSEKNVKDISSKAFKELQADNVTAALKTLSEVHSPHQILLSFSVNRFKYYFILNFNANLSYFDSS